MTLDYITGKFIATKNEKFKRFPKVEMNMRLIFIKTEITIDTIKMLVHHN